MLCGGAAAMSPMVPRSRAPTLNSAVAAPTPAVSALPTDEWQRLFDKYDVDNDGALAFDEAERLIEQIHPGGVRASTRKTFAQYDLDGDASLDYEEIETMLRAMMGLEVNTMQHKLERYTSESLWVSSLRNFGRSQVLEAIMKPLVAITAFSLLVALVHLGFVSTSVAMPWGFGACIARGGVKMHSLLGGALSLLLVFRTNTAYGRFWEARKIWESLGTRCREIARFSYLYSDVFGRPNVELVAKLLIAFPAQLRRHLCGVAPFEMEELPPWQIDAPGWTVTYMRSQNRALPHELAARAGLANPLGPLPPRLLQKLRRSQNRPLYLCRRLGMVLRSLPDSEYFSSRERLKALDGVDKLGAYVGACERLVQTPVPLNYARHTSRFLTLWCATLPLSLVADMGLLVVPVTSFVTWCLFGIQEIGLFIEHCALDHGAIFMDASIEQISEDVLEAIADDDEWAPPGTEQLSHAHPR